MPDAEVRREEELGLRLPDGTEIFPPGQWHGRSIETPEDRAAILAAVRLSESNLGFPIGELCARYCWVPRWRIELISFEPSDRPTLRLEETGYVAPTQTPAPVQ